MRLSDPIPEERLPMLLTGEQISKIKAAALGARQDLAGLTWFLEQAEQGQSEGLTRETARNVMGVTESKLRDLGQLLGVDTEAAQHIEARHAEIRRANLRIRELEGALGQAMPPEAIQPTLKQLADKLDAWWDREGFGHIRETHFGAWNAKVEFSCRFIGSKPYVPGAEGKPHAERKALWLADLQRRGFVLNDDDGKGVTDCEASRHALRVLFEQRFPAGGHTIAEFISSEVRGQSTLSGVKVYLRKLPQILDLPALPADAEEIDVDV